MKKRLSLIVAACFVAAIFAFTQCSKKPQKSVKTPNIEGTWKLTEVNGQTFLETQLKVIAGNRFMWMVAGGDGVVIQGAGGTFTFEGTDYVETLDMATTRMRNDLGKKFGCEVVVYDNKLIQYMAPENSGAVLTWIKIDE